VAGEEVPEFDCRNWERMHDGSWVAFVYCDKERPREGGSGLMGLTRDHQRQALPVQGRNSHHDAPAHPPRRADRRCDRRRDLTCNRLY
jgi:hypothetical protein